MICINWTKVLIFITDSNNAMASLTLLMVLLTLAIVIISRKTYIANNRYQKKQLFETTFFNMMNQLEDIVSKLSIEDTRKPIENINITGREIFRYLFEESSVLIFDKDIISVVKSSVVNEESVANEESISFIFPNIDLKIGFEFGNETITDMIISVGISNIISDLGIKGYESCSQINLLDHYFRYLYRIMRFVDEADFLDSSTKDITKRYEYMGILRATLSPYELVFLFYNDLSKYGNEKVKPLIEKYSILKSLRKELLANTQMDYKLNLINDGLVSDYDRYIETKSPEKEFKRSFIYNASAVSKADNNLFNTN